MPDLRGTFPFGEPLRPVVQQDRTPKRVFVLGVYASAVHARWRDATGKQLVSALAVASEPTIFWDGTGAESIIARIELPPGASHGLSKSESRRRSRSTLQLPQLPQRPPRKPILPQPLQLRDMPAVERAILRADVPVPLEELERRGASPCPHAGPCPGMPPRALAVPRQAPHPPADTPPALPRPMRLDAHPVSDTLPEMASPLPLQGLRHVRPVEPVEFPSSDPEWDMPESKRHRRLCFLLYEIPVARPRVLPNPHSASTVRCTFAPETSLSTRARTSVGRTMSSSLASGRTTFASLGMRGPSSVGRSVGSEKGRSKTLAAMSTKGYEYSFLEEWPSGLRQRF